MQRTSALYRSILADPHHKTETRLTIGESGVLMTEHGDTITFGGTRILVADGGADSGFDFHSLVSLKTTAHVFPGNRPGIGYTVSADIDVKMLRPAAQIPRTARLVPYVRLTDDQGRKSEWLQKGVFFIDTRKHEQNRRGEELLTIHGYDAMLRAEAPYPSSTREWPSTDADVIREIASTMQVPVDPRTWDIVKNRYRINYPAEYSMREVLGIIGAMYAGNWYMTDLGELRLAVLNGIPAETRLLIDEQGYQLTFGGDRIRV